MAQNSVSTPTAAMDADGLWSRRHAQALLDRIVGRAGRVHASTVGSE